MTDELPFPTADAAPPTANGGGTRRCKRHEWTWRGETPEDGEWCRFCHHPRDKAVSRTNRNNRLRGNRTSRDLADYLGGRNVEALKLPWDVEATGCRIQSKRLAERPSLGRIANLIEYVASEPAAAGTMCLLYYVGPNQRLASGRVFAFLSEWVFDHGWAIPSDAVLHNVRPVPLMELPLPTFRDLHIGGKG